MKKAATIFDHLANITFKKTDWNTLSELDQKSFSPYLINRWLSMNIDLIEIVDMFQQYTIGPLSKKHVYQLYCDVLPKQKMYSKYIKGKKSKDYNNDLLGLLTQHYQISKRDAKTYIDFWKENSVDDLKNLLKDYGKTEKEIKQWIK
tara:strand:+ start:21682 stop:22122 length:441 start_codon:yes stop_codon:yes gene_type:complete